MAARKNRPVLYEVARLSRRQCEASRRRSGGLSASEPADSEGAASSQLGTSVTPDQPRTLRIARGRLHVMLGWPGLAVIAIGALFVLVVTFQAGVRYVSWQQPPANPASSDNVYAAPASHSDDPSPGGLTPDHRPADGTGVVTPGPPPREPRSGLERPAAAPVTEAAATFEFKPGHSYVVIQHFKRSRLNAAEQAYHFVRDRGVECVILRGSDFQLVATEPFQLRQGAASARTAGRRRCEALKQRIREIGKEYAEHGYAFEQCYERVIRQ